MSALETATRESGLKALRWPVYNLIEPVTRWLVRRGVHPNVVTVAGFVATVVAGILYSQDHVRTAGFLVLLGGLFDIFDGRVARVSGLASKFGNFFDSTLDRISEIAMYLGFMTLYNDYGTEMAALDVTMIYVITLALGGSLMVSYTRAKAEALGFDCSVGFMQRAERIVLLGLASLVFGLAWDGAVLSWVIVGVAVLTNATAVQRIVWVYRRGKGVPLERAANAKSPQAGGRNGKERTSGTT